MMNTRNIKRNKKKKQILFGLTLFSLLSILLVSLLVEPIPQESNYHNFADSREIWSISNFWNVVSNLPFFIVGILALYKLIKWNSLTIVQEIRASYILLFVGDLRYYALVQFLPIVLIPVILLSFDSEFTDISGYWWLLFCYFLAKIFEHFDWQIYEILGGMSGHSLKHMVAGLGLYLLLNSFERRMIKK